jgi:predicted RNase H-like HicB family nuclease
MKSYTFRILIEPDENNTYHAWAPGLPGCHTWGDTLQEARQNLKDAIRAYVANLADSNLPIPEEQGFEYYETISESEIRPAT